MVQIAGKYQFVENKNLAEFLKGLGIEAAFAEAILADKAGIEVKVDGNKITLEHDDSKGTTTFTPGAEFEETAVDGSKVKSIATLKGDVLEISSTKEGVSVGSKTYNFSSSGLELVATNPKDGKLYSATRIFKKV